jgi:hypothetical protein
MKLATTKQSKEYIEQAAVWLGNTKSLFSSVGNPATYVIAEYMANQDGKTLYSLLVTPSATMYDVDSSVISSIGYLLQERDLFVEFNSGSEYKYSDVPLDKFHEFLAADSKGSFYSQEIKGVFNSEKV